MVVVIFFQVGFTANTSRPIFLSIFDPAKCNKGEGIMSYISFNFVYQTAQGVDTRTEGVALASKLSGGPSVLFDMQQTR